MSDSPSSSRRSPRPLLFTIVCSLGELSLVPLGATIIRVWPRRGWPEWSMDGSSLLLGVVGALPPLALLLWLLSPAGIETAFTRRTMRVLWEAAGPTLARLELWHIAVLAAGAGIGEEYLFRGALQPRLGIVVTSLVFGVVHPLGLTYAALVAAFGAYLGWLADRSGNLVVPALVHTVYDTVALWAIRRELRLRPPAEGSIKAPELEGPGDREPPAA